MTHRAAQTLFLGVLDTVVLCAALRLGQEIFAPLLTGNVLGMVCAPFADLIERTGLPRLALLLVLACLALLIMCRFVSMGQPSTMPHRVRRKSGAR
jgi:predicted PurR-regulated permease PerM